MNVPDELILPHYICEDGHYSCPKSNGYYGLGPDDTCECGADEHNEKIAQVIKELATVTAQRDRLVASLVDMLEIVVREYLNAEERQTINQIETALAEMESDE